VLAFFGSATLAAPTRVPNPVPGGTRFGFVCAALPEPAAGLDLAATGTAALEGAWFSFNHDLINPLITELGFTPFL